jgi:AcrR family transcriptional regulator
VSRHGLSELSLRELADGVGTSHRMLLYHFGSRAGLVAAVAAAVEERQRAALAAIPDDATTQADVVEAVWRQVADPAVLPFVPLFFEVLGQALQRRPGTEGFLAHLTEPWVEEGLALARDRGAGDVLDAADAQLAIAVVRGLLVDLAATGDRAAADAALARFTDRLRAVDP